MKKLFFILAAMQLLQACGESKQTNPTENTSAAANPAPASAEAHVHLSKAQIQNAQIAWAAPETKPVYGSLQAFAVAEALPSQRATVSSRIAGQVEQILVKPGQDVRQGQVIAYLQSPAIMDIQQLYLQAKADLLFLDKELERQRAMQAENVGAARNLQEIESRHARAKSDLEIARAKLEYLGVDVRQLQDLQQLKISTKIAVVAPLSGNVTEVVANLGASVAEGAPICMILGNNNLYASVEIYQKDLAWVQPGQEVDLEAEGGGLEPIRARVESISHEVNAQRQTVSVRVPLPNSTKLYPAMKFVAHIHTQARPMRTVPESAMVRDEEQFCVFYTTNPSRDTVEFTKYSFPQPAQTDGRIALPELPEGALVVHQGGNRIYSEYKRSEMAE